MKSEREETQERGGEERAKKRSFGRGKGFRKGMIGVREKGKESVGKGGMRTPLKKGETERWRITQGETG